MKTLIKTLHHLSLTDENLENGSMKIMPLMSIWSPVTEQPRNRLRHRSFSFESMSTTTSPVISEISSFDDLDLCENLCQINTDYDDCIVEDMNNAMFNDFI